MNWLTEYVRPKIRTLFGQRDVPDNLWGQCSACQQMVFNAELDKNLRVCSHCGHHMRVKATQRLAWTFDGGKHTRIDLPKPPVDQLKFRDSKRYVDRLKEYREKTHLDDAIVVAHGAIGGHRAVVAVMSFDFMGGSMGSAVGEGIVAAAKLAVLQAEAAARGVHLAARDREWTVAPMEHGFRFTDAGGRLDLPPPALLGAHQLDNAGIAIAALRASGLGLRDDALARGVASAVWPARMQRLTGKLAAGLPAGWEVWLDGGHNPGGGAAVAAQLRHWADRPVHVVVGMKQAKDTAEFLAPILPLASSLWAVAEPGQHLALPVDAIVAASGGAAQIGPTVRDALARIIATQPPGRVLICGSLYLAGEVLKADGWVPV